MGRVHAGEGRKGRQTERGKGRGGKERGCMEHIELRAKI